MKNNFLVLLLVFGVGLQAVAEGRDWAVNPTSFISLILNDQYRPSSGSNENRNGYSFNIDFGRNWGMYELGPVLRYSYFKEDSSKDTDYALGVYGRYNFIENKVGEFLIPFVRLAVSAGEFKSEADSSTTTRGTYLRFRTGATWFPVNDYVALEGAVEYYDRKYAGDSDYSYGGVYLLGNFAVYF